MTPTTNGDDSRRETAVPPRKLRAFRPGETPVNGEESKIVEQPAAATANVRRLPSARSLRQSTPRPVAAIERPAGKVAASASRPACTVPSSPAPNMAPVAAQRFVEELRNAECGMQNEGKKSVPNASRLNFKSANRNPKSEILPQSEIRNPKSEILPKSTIAKLASSPEFQIPVAWWNAMPLSVGIAIAIFGFTWITIENLSASLTVSKLAARLDQPLLDRRKLSDDLTTRVDSPMSRFDGRRDYVVARVLAAIEETPIRPALVGQRPENAQAVYHNVGRAVQRSPANPWYRLSRAMLSEKFDWDKKEKIANWAAVERMALPTGNLAEPTYWRRWADNLRISDRIDDALTAYQKFLSIRPESTTELLKSFAEARVAVRDQVRALPPHRVALGQAVAHFKDLGIAEWRTLAEQMLALPKTPSDRTTPDELAAEAIVAQAMDQNDRAVDLFQIALKARPNRTDWKQRLAKLLYERREYAEAARLADSIIHNDPSGEYAVDARLLRERISLIVGSSALKAN